MFSLATMVRGARPGVLTRRGTAGSLSFAGSTLLSGSFAGTGVLTLIFMRSVTCGASPSGYGSAASFVIITVVPSGRPLKSMITSKRSPGAITRWVFLTGAGSSPPSEPMTQKGTSVPVLASKLRL